MPGERLRVVLVDDHEVVRSGIRALFEAGDDAEGHTNREIGNLLKLAEKTVKNYVSTILSKLEVARRAEAAAYLERHRTIPGSS